MFFRLKHSKSGQVLQLLESYRNSEGKPRQRVVVSLGDAGISRTFHLYEEQRILDILEPCQCQLIEPENKGDAGGLMYFDDLKPMHYCVLWARKE